VDLKLDGYTSHAGLLNDSSFIRSLISELASHIGMTIVNGPTVHSFQDSSPGPDSGLSAFAIIAESNISIHTWPESAYFTMDIFSCRYFNSESACLFIKDKLFVSEVVRYVIDPSRAGPPQHNI
jgi:S-adenosylmethionine decarboxylase